MWNKFKKVYTWNSKINVDLVKAYNNEACILNKYFVFKGRVVWFYMSINEKKYAYTFIVALFENIVVGLDGFQSFFDLYSVESTE